VKKTEEYVFMFARKLGVMGNGETTRQRERLASHWATQVQASEKPTTPMERFSLGSVKMLDRTHCRVRSSHDSKKPDSGLSPVSYQ